MKLQDVILRAMAKKLTWIDAAEIAGISPIKMHLRRRRYQVFGYTGLFGRRRRKRIVYRIPMETAERVLQLYQEKYADVGVHLFYNELREREGIRLPFNWVKQALLGADLMRPGRGPKAR